LQQSSHVTACRPAISAAHLGRKEFAAPSVFEPAKLLGVGEQPVKLAIDAYYNAIRKKGGNDTWVTQLTLTFLFPD